MAPIPKSQSPDFGYPIHHYQPLLLHIYYSLLPLFIRRQNGFAWFFSLFFYSLNCHFLVFNAVVFRVSPPINGAEINPKSYYSIVIKLSKSEPLLMQASSYHPWLRHYLSFYSSSLIIILGQIFFQQKVLRETSGKSSADNHL